MEKERIKKKEKMTIIIILIPTRQFFLKIAVRLRSKCARIEVAKIPQNKQNLSLDTNHSCKPRKLTDKAENCLDEIFAYADR